MADWKLRLYHQMPPFMRNWVASMRGYQLRSWRYGPETEQLVAEALERDHWSSEQWKTYQENRLQYVLHRAATQVPYYRQQWSDRRRKGDQSSWENLENWTILEKESLRQNPQAFVADDIAIAQMFHTHTSGTTGKPISIYWSKTGLRFWYALFEARWRRWYGLSMSSRWAILGGQLIAHVSQKDPPFWTWNRAMNQLYMSSYHIEPRNVPLYLKAIRDHSVEYIYCYTSSGYALAEEALRSNLDVPQIKAALTNAEPVYSYQRDAIVAAFQCPLYETYGLSEAVLGASECECGSMHLWPDAGITEVIDGSQSANVGEIGDIVATGFANTDMLFVRYRIGDQAALKHADTECACGRSLPQMLQIQGRSDDVLYTVDGRRVGRLDPVFKANLPIHEAQIIQDQLDHLLVRVVPAPGYSNQVEHDISERLQERLGPIKIDFERLQQIPRTANGKFRAVISNLSPEERARISS